jgi:alpha-ribazole phosphatase
LNSKKTLAKAQIDKRLMELNFGDWEQAFWKDFEQSKYAQKWFKDFVNISCPNGESYAQLIERTASFLKDLKEFPADSKVLIVTHGGVIRAFNVLINHIEAKNAFDLKVDYGEVFELSC